MVGLLAKKAKTLSEGAFNFSLGDAFDLGDILNRGGGHDSENQHVLD